MTTGRSGLAWLALFFAAGALSFVAQAVLFREYLVLYQGSELVIGLFFGAWLAWVAAGAALGRLAPRTGWSPALQVAVLGSAHALAPFVQLVLLRSTRQLTGVPAWQAFPPDLLLGVTLVGLAPVSVLTGALFTVACAAAADHSEAPKRGDVSARYVAECVGSFAGGAAVTAGIEAGLGEVMLLIGAALALSLATAWVSISAKHRAASWLAGTTSAILVVATLTGGVTAANEALERARWRGVLPQGTLLASTSTPYQHVAVGQLGGQIVIARDGRLDAAVPDDPGHAEVAALLFAQRPAARRILVVGDAATGLLRHLLLRGPEEVVWIDDDPDATALLRAHLPAADLAALTDPRVRVATGDPRVRVRERGGVFDVIAVLTADPMTAHGNRLYTRQFLLDLKRRLATGGVFASRIAAEPNYLAGDVLTMGASLDRTLRSVFHWVAVTPGDTWWLFAGDSGTSLSVDPDILAARLAEAPAAGGYAPERIAGVWSTAKLRWLKGRLDSARADGDDKLLNTDRRPVAMLLALAWRLRALDSDIGSLLMALRSAGAWPWLALLLICLCGRLLHVGFGPTRAANTRHPPRARADWQRGVGTFNALALVAVAGGCGMALATIWMLAFQGRFGAIFAEIGLVGGLFVLGLAAGGAVTLRALRSGARREEPHVLSWRPATLYVCAAGAILVTLTPALIWLDGVDNLFAWPLFLLAFLLSGAISGAALPLAEAMLAPYRQTTAEVAAGLEGADHLGGAAAAGVVGAVLLPTLGVLGTTWLLAASLVAVALLLVQQRWLQGRAPPKSTRPESWRWRPPTATALVGATIVGCAIAGGALIRAQLEQPQLRFDEATMRSWVGDGVFVERDAPFAHYVVDPPADRPPRGALAASMAVAADVRGYAGPINLLVAVDAAGLLSRIRLLETRDTPAYIRGLGQWLQRLEGRAVAIPLSAHAPDRTRTGDPGEVDVLTGATVTSEAALAAINLCGAALATHALALPPARTQNPTPLSRRLLQPAVLYLLISLLLAIVVARRAGARLRRLVLATHVLIGGLLLNTQLSTVDLARLVRLELPTLETPEVFLLFFGALALGLAFGPLYCAGLCPLGAAQELLGSLGLAGRLHHRLEDGARKLKYLVLIAVVCLAASGDETGLLAGDPLRFGLGRHAEDGALLLLLVLALGSVFVIRPWCRYLCPVGAGLNLLNRLRLADRWLRPRIYGACDLGVDGPWDADCLQCDRCVTGCTLPVRPQTAAEADTAAAGETGGRP